MGGTGASQSIVPDVRVAAGDQYHFDWQTRHSNMQRQSGFGIESIVHGFESRQARTQSTPGKLKSSCCPSMIGV
jgi:hypothetical protein